MSKEISDPKEQIEEPVVQTKEENVVAYETYSKVLGETKKVRAANRELQEKLEALEKEKEEKLKAEMEQNNQYKELAEMQAKENEQLKQALVAKDEKIDTSYRLQAFKEALPGRITNPKYYSFVDLKSIILEENGVANKESVKVVVDKFMSEHSNLVKVEDVDPPSVAPNNTSVQKLTEEEWAALPLAEKRKRFAEYREAMKSQK